MSHDATGSGAAVVTGGSRGIGRGVALHLARAGFDVVVNYARDSEAAARTVAEIEAAGARGYAIQADISRAEDRERLVAEAYASVGAIKLLVNNAGVAPTVRADLLEATEESFDRVLAVNLKGPYFLTQAVARRMVEQIQSGRLTNPKIITVGSISSYTASVNRGDYCLAKAGLAMLTTLYATRLAEYGINVYEVRPGIVDTEMTGPAKEKYDRLILEQGLTPIRRWGQPDDVGRAVLAIAIDLFPFSTGQVVDVDGGFHLRSL